MTKIMPSLQNLIKLSYDALPFAGALFCVPWTVFLAGGIMEIMGIKANEHSFRVRQKQIVF